MANFPRYVPLTADNLREASNLTGKSLEELRELFTDALKANERVYVEVND